MKKPTIWFWILGLLFLLWNLTGCYFYYVDQTMSDAAYTETYGAAMAAVRNLYPVWSVAAYAIAVWGGLLAAILFLLRKGWAVPLFTLSLIAAVISFIWPLVNAEARAAAGSTGFIMPAVVFVLGLVEVFYARAQRAAGVLR